MASLNENEMMDEEEAKEIIHEMGIYENIESFTAEAYNAKGQKVKYDSKTKKVIVAGSGFMLTASKYLFLLFLITAINGAAPGHPISIYNPHFICH